MRPGLNEYGVLETTTKARAEILSGIRRQLTLVSAEDDWVAWGRWFLVDRATRTISPFSMLTVPEFIENRIKENTAESLAEAERLALGNVGLLKRISDACARMKQIEQPPRSP